MTKSVNFLIWEGHRQGNDEHLYGFLSHVEIVVQWDVGSTLYG